MMVWMIPCGKLYSLQGTLRGTSAGQIILRLVAGALLLSYKTGDDTCIPTIMSSASNLCIVSGPKLHLSHMDLTDRRSVGFDQNMLTVQGPTIFVVELVHNRRPFPLLEIATYVSSKNLTVQCQLNASGLLLQFCHQRPKYVQGTTIYNYCGKSCARAAQASAKTPTQKPSKLRGAL